MVKDLFIIRRRGEETVVNFPAICLFTKILFKILRKQLQNIILETKFKIVKYESVGNINEYK